MYEQFRFNAFESMTHRIVCLAPLFFDLLGKESPWSNYVAANATSNMHYKKNAHVILRLFT